jgi:hypothetical protein
MLKKQYVEVRKSSTEKVENTKTSGSTQIPFSQSVSIKAYSNRR